jgi:F0F1-type ATP synthase assembly protein I
MPDDPSEGASKPEKDPKELLREKLERIEREDSLRASDLSGTPSNDEIREDSFASPIESQLAGDVPLGEPNEDPREIRLRQLEEELEQASAAHREKVTGIQSEFDERMRNLETKLDRVREQREGKRVQEQVRTNIDASASKGLGLGLQIAYTIIGLPLIGALIGYFIDRATGATLWTGLLAVAGMAGGVTLTVMFMGRSSNQK